MNELQRVTDIDEVIKYAERRAEGCHQMASSYHTDEGVYLQEETRCMYRAILWGHIHEWLEELKERRKKASIIFCRECEYYKTPQRYAYKEPNPYCCRSALTKVSEDDFCSKAIRKEGGKE